MKIQIDTDLKIIRLEEKVNLGRFIEDIRKMLPNAWSSFELDCTAIYNWSNPVIIKEYPNYPIYPTLPWITCTSNDTNPYSINFNSETYNIEIE